MENKQTTTGMMMRRNQGTTVRATSIALITTLFVATAVQAVDQVVKNNSDTGSGSLRNAIFDVHDGGTITFAGDYTITLQSNLPAVTKNITIIGQGCKQTIIDGDGSYRSFEIRSGGTLTLKRLTLRNGKNVENTNGTLTLDGIVIHGNTEYAGGIRSIGDGASLAILNSTIHGNTATNRAGGIYCGAGTVLVKNSTIYDNTSEYYGAGICIEGGTMTIDSCTIANNKFSGSYGSAKGGGIILMGGALTIQNTILANNQDSSGDNDYYFHTGDASSLTDNGYNFVEVSNTSDSTGFANGVNNNIVGVDPTGLASSVSYEGGWTPVLKVTAGNIGGANYGSTTETRDQRGYHRKSTEITRGAYQYDGIVARLFFGDWDGGYPTIAGAVAAGSEGDVINIIDAVVKETNITIPKSHAIMGVTTDAQIWGDEEAGTAAGRIFDIAGGGVLIKDVTIKYGNVTGQGGGIRNTGASLELTNCVIAGNTGTTSSGGVYNASASNLRITECTIRDNIAGITGGGLSSEGTLLTAHSTITGNTANNGGGVCIDNGTANLQNCTICGNTSSGGGAGLYMSYGVGTFANCTVSENVASSGSGGGFDGYMGQANFLNSIIVNNTAASSADLSTAMCSIHAQNSWYADATGVTTPSTASNVITAYTAGDLLALADNGGSTLTMKLSVTAPAVGAGDFVYYNSTNGYYCKDSNGDYLDATGSTITPADPAGDKITTDQRGTTRVAPCTIGAYHQTSPLPVVTTAKVSNVDSDSADCGGEVTSEGSSSVTARGVCWNTTGSPTTSAYKTSDGSGSGTFTSSIAGLYPGTTYYVRAYATNTTGTAYGAQREFTTSVTKPTLTTTEVTNITETTADCGGQITSQGGRPVTICGVCWNTSGTPTTDDDKTTRDFKTKTLYVGAEKPVWSGFTETITGLTPATTYYIRAYAINKEGTGYGPQQTFKTAGSASAPDLRVAVQAAETKASVGEEVGFNVDVQNVGTASATGVTLRLPLPQGTEFVGIYLAPGQTSRSAPLDATVDNGVIIVQLGDVAASMLLKLELVLKAITSGNVAVQASASCTESATPATAQVEKEIDVDDAYLVITRSGPAFNACGLLGIMSPLLSIAGMLAMKRSRRRRF